ncbi:galactokinase [Litorimonas sp. WD9-15]|uniref:galactokinase n=1 Tax=Litorimonas sp. WD9-15 TaxID=3418716 RepID=UPI003D01BAAA
MIVAEFKRVFDIAPSVTGFTPGRVNLIGEHTDYNGGNVLPTALDLGVTLALAPREDGLIRIWSDKFDGIAERKMTDAASDHWSDYIAGALQLARSEGFGPDGANIAVTTTLPFGAGISSSAAVTVGVIRAAAGLSDNSLTDTDIAVLARRVENEYIGMPCGIMDQMAVAIAKPGQALSLDTKYLEFGLVNLPETHHMAVIHSGVFRQLNEGRYKIRKEECDAVKAALGHDDLCLMTDAEFASLAHLAAPLRRRAKHCMTEHRRTVAATVALQKGEMAAFGVLMNESHISMRDDFEMSVQPVDALVADAQKFGATGARLTGGGFGGCIVACIEKEKLGAWRTALLDAHPDAFWVC